MEKECYYFRHIIDQTLFAYLEYGKKWDDTFCFVFRQSDIDPHYYKVGTICENRNSLIAFKYLSQFTYKQIVSDVKLDWFRIEPEPWMEIKAKDFISVYRNNDNKGNINI